jgi:predicted flap endonuclease-1-like 5' DNA nuclease
MGKTVVLAYFQDEAAADDAVESLKAWDKLDNQVKLNALGVLVLDENGQLKNHKMGRRTVGKGAGIGLILAMLTPVGLGAAVAGGALGALHRKKLGIQSEQQQEIAAQLSGGKAAVGVLVAQDQAPSVSEKLAELGGNAETVEVPAEAMAEAEAAAPQIEQEETTAGDDLSIIDGIGSRYADTLKAGGVKTFAALGAMSSEEIESLLSDAGNPLFAGHNAATWPRQARYAANQDWSGLRRYIDSTKASVGS